MKTVASGAILSKRSAILEMELTIIETIKMVAFRWHHQEDQRK